MVQMKCYGNGDIQLVDHCLYHVGNSLKAAHILARTLGNTENYRRLQLFRGEQDCLRPFQVVDVELSYSVVTFFCFGKHFFC